MDIFRKKPDEVVVKGFDKTTTLPTGVTIVDIDVTVTEYNADGAVANGILIENGVSPQIVLSGKAVQALFQAGTDGMDYLIRYEMTLSDSQVWIDEYLMEVRL